jgi:hypothetical protein
MRTFMKIGREIPNLVKIEKSIGKFTWRSKYVLLLLEHTFTTKVFLWKAQHVYIVVSDM